MMFKFLTAIAAVFATSAHANLDPCMIGDWEANSDDIALMVARQVRGDATVQSGTVLLSIDSDGTYRLQAARLQLQITAGSGMKSVTVSGVATGMFNLLNETWFSTIEDNQLRATMEGTSVADTYLGRALGSYYCSGNSLRLESEPGFGPTNLPRAWERTG